VAKKKAVVGPSLGQEAIDNGILSSLVVLLLVLSGWCSTEELVGMSETLLLLNLVLLFGCNG
jgi:SecD/SecF fusion protein